MVMFLPYHTPPSLSDLNDLLKRLFSYNSPTHVSPSLGVRDQGLYPYEDHVKI
jgi:hypothetical protein